MTRSFQVGISNGSSPQSKASGSYTMPLPTEFVTCRAYGSIFERSPSAVRIVNRYSAPGATPATSTDQVPVVPSPSGASSVELPAQSSNVPVTKTATACGAQTRNVVPPGWGTAPMPGRSDGALVSLTVPTIAGRPLSPNDRPGRPAGRDGRRRPDLGQVAG